MEAQGRGGGQAAAAAVAAERRVGRWAQREGGVVLRAGVAVGVVWWCQQRQVERVEREGRAAAGVEG